MLSTALPSVIVTGASSGVGLHPECVAETGLFRYAPKLFQKIFP
jgi:hypothetical protein